MYSYTYTYVILAKESQHSDLHAGDYHLIGADLRQLEELEQKLNSIEIDYKLPTLVISECVLIYMSTESSSALLKFFSQKFETIGFLNYEQVRPFFGDGIVLKEVLDLG